uniref:SET domain-containing protein n=1 Tax=Takifugu rubripes TaxID=31033 RepID=A0A674MY40_TAKRU
MADGGSNLKNPSRRKPRLNPQHDAEKHIQCKTDKAGLREVFVSSYKGQFSISIYSIPACISGVQSELQCSGCTTGLVGTSLSLTSLFVFFFFLKGRGVFASVPFSKGDFVLEYKGKLLSLDNSATNTYNSTEATFLFDFQWKGKYFCIDASLEDQSLGRLVNDEHIIPNCKMRTIAVNGMPHLCLFAIRDIMAGEEVTYNYGDSDWPWRKQVW